MKIKADFITNSSSTAYVVFIPNNLYLKKDEIKSLYEKVYHDGDGNEPTNEQLYDEFPELLEILKSGDHLWLYGYSGINPDLWNMILILCDQRNLTISTLELDGEGNNTIQGVQEEDIIKNISK